MNPTSKIEKRAQIHWAVDPFQNPKLAKHIIAELKSWAKHLDCDVQPVAIVSTSLLKYPLEIASSINGDFPKAAYSAAENYLKKAKAKGFLKPKIVFSEKASNRQMALDLSTFSKQSNALMIFANTHAKQSWNPLRLGGFAETLIAVSRIPVLLINDKVKTKARLNTILFPTNFSSDSRKALTILASLIKNYHAKVQIFNQVERTDMSLYSPLYFGYAPTLDLPSLEKTTEDQRHNRGAKWVEYLSELGVKAVPLIQRQRKLLSFDIISAAKSTNANLIAMTSERGLVAGSILGSTVRDVLLHAPCPVLVMHKPQLSKNIKKESARRKQAKLRFSSDSDLVLPSQIS
tara:strand:+ start:3441 stop:4481 length:1041 start_codon:yes stop_codon:yes gene_type:complete